MAEIRIGFGESLDKYKTKSIESSHLDISINLENRTTIEINTRKTGFKIDYNGKNLLDLDY